MPVENTANAKIQPIPRNNNFRENSLALSHKSMTLKNNNHNPITYDASIKPTSLKKKVFSKPKSENLDKSYATAAALRHVNPNDILGSNFDFQKNSENEFEDGVSFIKTNTADKNNWQIVRNKKIKRKKNTVTGSRRDGNFCIKGAPKIVDIFLGGCELQCTPENIKNYCLNELGITLVSCTQLNTRNKFMNSYKLTLHLNDRDKLLNPESWPDGIYVRKFYSNKDAQ